MNSIGAANASWSQYAVDNNLTPEETQAGLDKIAKGDMPDNTNITKVIVNGYKDGVLVAGAWYIGPEVALGKAIASGALASGANGAYQSYDLSQPGNDNKMWDYKGSAASFTMGMLAPGRTYENIGIAFAGSIFSNGADMEKASIAAGSAGVGTALGIYAPKGVDKIIQNNVPGYVYDAFGGLGSEFLNGYTNNLVNPSAATTEQKNNGSGK
ncbi:adhesin [Enterobacteriaceae bacterium H16N7]|nr:adhesin [Dryocola clanedunensis]